MGKPEIIPKRKREPKAESLKDIILKKLTKGEKEVVLISHLTLGSIPDARRIYRLVGEAQRRAGRQATVII